MSDVISFDQEWNERGVQQRLEEWVNKWSDGANWGIVGGHGNRKGKTPDTVLGQAERHGQPEQSRSGTASFDGLGELVVAIQNLLSGTITAKEIEQFNKAVDEMEAVLKDPKKNPQNIPFRTVVYFAETDDPKKPEIVRAEVHGHYRTTAYNKYLEWDNEVNGEDHKIVEADDKWWNKNEGKAKPPLLECIKNNKDGIMKVVKTAKKSIGKKGEKVKQKRGTVALFNVKRTPGRLKDISTMKQHVLEILNDPNIYPKGRRTTPMPTRLNDAFSNKVFTATPNDIAILEEMMIGFKDMPGSKNLKQYKLKWPKSNVAINKLIREVMGNELSTFQKPGTTPDQAPPGINLQKMQPISWEGMLRNES